MKRIFVDVKSDESVTCFTVEVGTSSSKDIPGLFGSHLVPPSSSRRFIVVGVESMTESTADPSNLGICVDNFLLIHGKCQIDGMPL